jgi:hypothetical protein
MNHLGWHPGLSERRGSSAEQEMLKMMDEWQVMSLAGGAFRLFARARRSKMSHHACYATSAILQYYTQARNHHSNQNNELQMPDYIIVSVNKSN